jgi:hypothetical protein
MSFIKGLFVARSHFAFLLGLGGAVATGLSIDCAAPGAQSASMSFDQSLKLSTTALPTRETGVPLTPQEQQWARTAWKYFENNYQKDTGLVNSVDAYPSTTLWDLGSYLMGLIAARDLGIVERADFDARLDRLLDSLQKLPLVDGIAPNKAYHTKSLQMVNYGNVATPKGIGWSVIDVARIGVPLTLLVWLYPERTESIRRLLHGWRFDELVQQGQLVGATRDGKTGVLERKQEGRFGYEQYAAKSLRLLGLDVSRSIRYDAEVSIMPVSGQPVAYDARLPADHGGTHNAVTSEPYILEAIEHGLTSTTLPLARSLYLAQRNRHAQNGIFTAVSEDNLDRAPYFIYGTVLNDRKEWATFTPDGTDAQQFRTVSLKAAFGWSYIFQDHYSDELLAYIGTTCDPAKGWYSGRYESDGSTNRALTANTNGIVLEILYYRTRGPFLKTVLQPPPK